MIFEFYKYQGTGNDFIIIDDRDNNFDIKDDFLIKSLCERRMGIGADGLILLRQHQEFDFEMLYFNSDGFPSTMCGNGGRCIVAFANMLGIIENDTIFMAIDGVHKAKIIDHDISLSMKDVTDINQLNNAVLLDTGSPHYVTITDDLDSFDVEKKGRGIRHSSVFKKEGINVNFAQEYQEGFKVRTYERGVENETLSCGTGVVATAIVMHYTNLTQEEMISIYTPGGQLTVSFEAFNSSYKNIWLTAPADLVYAGEFEC